MSKSDLHGSIMLGGDYQEDPMEGSPLVGFYHLNVDHSVSLGDILGDSISTSSIHETSNFVDKEKPLDLSKETFSKFKKTRAAEEVKKRFEGYTLSDIILLLTASVENNNGLEGSLMDELIHHI